MKIPEGFYPVSKRTYAVVKHTTGRHITLNEMTEPDGREFVQYKDEHGNILLVDKKNLQGD